MRTRRRSLARVFVLVLVLGAAAVVIKAETEATRLTTNAPALRKVPKQTPASDGLSFVDAGVTTVEGLKLVGWYIPGTNGVTVIFVHGYKNDRGSMLGSAAMFRAHGYGALVIALRAHDPQRRRSHHVRPPGGRGSRRLGTQFAVHQPNIDPRRIAPVGVSMGGAISIQCAASESENRRGRGRQRVFVDGRHDRDKREALHRAAAVSVRQPDRILDSRGHGIVVLPKPTPNKRSPESAPGPCS